MGPMCLRAGTGLLVDEAGPHPVLDLMLTVAGWACLCHGRLQGFGSLGAGVYLPVPSPEWACWGSRIRAQAILGWCLSIDGWSWGSEIGLQGPGVPESSACTPVCRAGP